MTEQPSSDIGWLNDYTPPSKNPRLYAAHYCPGCGVAEVCGEHNRETSCGDPSEYDPEDFHPATTSKQSLAQELRILPPPLSKWSQPHLPPGLTIATDPRPVGPERFAVGASAVLRLNGSEGAGRIGVLVGSDIQIHKFWLQQGKLGKKLHHIGYDAVIAPAYSTWWRGTPLEGLVSLSRSMTMVRMLSRHVPVIPTIGWRTGRDIERWCEWVNVGQTPSVAVHLGSRTKKAWGWNLVGVGILRQLLPESTQLVVIGPSTKERISTLSRIWGSDISILSQRPWQLAQQGYRLDGGLRAQRDFARTRGELAHDNDQRFQEVCADLVRRRGLRTV